ncbi:ScpA/B protein [Thermoplasmatales archaeon BRNA1]|nr:ScpA/B protein [Thermoplasmatales archaeon BRNA1]
MDGNIQMETMEQHLLFHKAMAEDPETLRKMNGYIETLHHAEDGEKLEDPVDEMIRGMFSLVLDSGMDPWAIDLEEFVKLYSEKVARNAFDMVVAGRLVLMAWRVLNMQSAEVRDRADPPVLDEPEYDEGDFAFEDEDPMIVPEVSFTRAYARDEPRAVTMMDLIEAFEEARAESEIRNARLIARAKMEAKAPLKFENKAHEEDDEAVVERVLEKVRSASSGSPIALSSLYTQDIKENITIFVSVLHLVRDGMLDVTQETLPYGEIMVSVIYRPAAAQTDVAATA